MVRDITGQTVLIAGASSGMGRATALAAAEAGVNLILLGRNADRLDETLTSARSAGRQARISSVVADASDADVLADAFKGIDLTTVDVLINSVGMNLVERAFGQLTPDSWAAMIQANLTAAFNLCRCLVPPMRLRGDGLIINISSVAARKPDRSGAAYQASKAGVLALNHAIMEEEWANGLRATAILPGMTDTPLLDRRPTPVSAEVRSAALQPEDIAEACLFVMRMPRRAHVSELVIQPSRR
ncbi:SDR family oxidoreductase [Microvirga sp. Mcv34]|uniref:SDR family oxidoreductase n=1 Tax=Microvirga sp. Mcv34 TaxID=2926016 RepID=UPI0021C6182B|nr:SDR family NAD(P)-dependent oxidoreductase [Microvirga sp. Mcv34]